MKILDTAIDAVTPYMMWLKLAALMAAIALFVGSGYKLGVTVQTAADATDLRECNEDLLANAVNNSNSERRGREAAAKEYEAEIKSLNDRNALNATALAAYEQENQKLSKINAQSAHIIEVLRRDKANANFLDQPIPPAIRDGLLNPAH